MWYLSKSLSNLLTPTVPAKRPGDASVQRISKGSDIIVVRPMMRTSRDVAGGILAPIRAQPAGNGIDVNGYAAQCLWWLKSAIDAFWIVGCV